MRCKKHLSDPSSAVGVCASCLRQRLLTLIDAQSQPLPLPPPDDDVDRRRSDSKHPPHHLPPPPPLVFPRSVSPYISRRKSDTGATAYEETEFSDDGRKQQRFFSTPQAGPTASKAAKKKSKFNLFSSVFRSGSAKSRRSSDPFSDSEASRPNPNPNLTVSELYAHPSPSSSWIPRRKKSILRLSSLDETSSSSTYDGRRDRGMSPDVDYDIGCSPDSWRRTPSSAHGSSRPSQARVTASPARSQLTSGIGFCLSPLMRPSPGRHWKGKATGIDNVYSGEIRTLSTAASLRANRSRKLADFGRFDHNR